VNKASFGHIRSFVKPVLNHFDDFELWVPNDFAVHTFRVIMFSIQAQYSYAVIETLMLHLDQHTNVSNAKTRTSMADVLAKIIDIAAGESVGPSVLETVNGIVQHLQVSVKNDTTNGEDEKLYRETLISALGEYVTHLPDYQKIEIMKFIMQKVPSGSDTSASHRLLQNMLLKSLLMVGTKYRTTYLSTTFPITFLQPLLTLGQDDDAEIRLLVQNILHTLIDRHQNKERLRSPTLKLDGLVHEPCTRTDILFAKKNGGDIFTNLYESLGKKNNTMNNMNSVFTTIALFCVELFCEETLFDFLRLVMSLQELTITSAVLTPSQKIHLHVITLSLFSVIAHFLPILKDYTNTITKARREHAVHLLPPLKVKYAVYEPSQNIHESCLLNHATVIDLLKADGIEASNKGSYYLFPRHSWVDAHNIQSTSTADLNSISVEVDSGASTPVQSRQPEEIMTVEDLKRLLNESPDIRKEIESQRRKEITTAFKTITFEDLIAKAAAKGGNLQNKLSEIFTRMSVSNCGETTNQASTPPCVNKIQFPDMFTL
jgi:hypothetical protein